MARTPGSANPDYGFMNWFLNTGRKPLPAAPESSVVFRGSGQNIIYIDWDHDVVAVVRWIVSDEALNEFIEALLAALEPASSARREKAGLQRRSNASPDQPSTESLNSQG